MSPHFWIDVLLVLRDDICWKRELALFASLHVVGHRREPDIRIKPDLVTGMAVNHRPAPWLRHIADQKSVPPNHLGVVAEPFQELEEVRMSPISIARQSHHLPGRSIDGQRCGTGEAAIRVTADRSRRT